MSKKKEFWNSRAQLGETAGSNDFILKKLEIEALLKKIENNATVLDIGCGNGGTLMTLVEKRNCTGVGIDFAGEMVQLAKTSADNSGCNEKLIFMEGSLPNLPDGIGEFDYIITQRCLINLDSKELQQAAFNNIMKRVSIGGYYLMIESSIQGLASTNELRKLFELEEITPPWHNVFLDEEFVKTWSNDKSVLEEVIPIESTYHFLSRVVYAAVAKKTGEELKYDSDINLLALKLPIIGNLGPIRLWIWQKQ